LVLASNKQIEFKIQLGNQKDEREEMKPLKDLGSAMKATLYTEKIDIQFNPTANGTFLII